MQAARSPRRDGSDVRDGDLLRQVLTRNLLAVTLDPPESRGHSSDIPLLSESYINSGQNVREAGPTLCQSKTCDNGGQSVEDAGLGADYFCFSRSLPAVSESKSLPPVSRGGPHTASGCLSRAAGGRGCQSFRGAAGVSWLPVDPSIGLEEPHGPGSFSVNKPGEGVNQVCEETSHRKLLDTYACCCVTSANFGGCRLMGCQDSLSECSTGINNSCDGFDFHSPPTCEKSDDNSKPSSSGGKQQLHSGNRETPEVSAFTAFPFPSPAPLFTSAAYRSNRDGGTATSALCSSFSTVLSPDGYEAETLSFSSGKISRDEDYIVTPTTAAVTAGQVAMSPPVNLHGLSDCAHRGPVLRASHLTEDVTLKDSAHGFNPLTTKRTNRSRRVSEMRLPADGGKSVTPRLVQRSDLTFGPVIGKGGFGRVHKGELHGLPVAIKVVQKRRGSGVHREILQAERLAFSLRLRHTNIVHILGVNVCEDLRGEALIIMELVSARTLQVLLDEDNTVISLGERLRFGIEVCAALRYLHGHQLVHLDVKPQNVLLGEHGRCKLADFGNLTRTRPGLPREETDFTQLLGTLPYRAPELMKGQFPSCKADIYSLGITLWQMVSRQVPHGGANPHWLIYQVTKNNTRPVSHNTGNDVIEIRYCELYQACWDARPGARPEAEDAQRVLMELSGGLWDCGWGDNSYCCSRLG